MSNFLLLSVIFCLFLLVAPSSMSNGIQAVYMHDFIDSVAETDPASLYSLFSGCIILSKWYTCDDWVYDTDYSRLDPY